MPQALVLKKILLRRLSLARNRLFACPISNKNDVEIELAIIDLDVVEDLLQNILLVISIDDRKSVLKSEMRAVVAKNPDAKTVKSRD